MPPISLAWVRAWSWVAVVVTLLSATHGEPVDLTTPLPPLHGASVGTGGGLQNLCGREAPPVTPPVVEVTWERNSSVVAVSCPSKIRTFFPSQPLEPSPPLPTSLSSSLVTVGAGGRGVELNLTFAIQGSLRLPLGWWASGGDGLREMWVRVDGGLGMGGVCKYLPPTLETLDLSYTPLGELVLEESCAPSSLQHLEAIGSMLTRVSLCTPALTTLDLNNNEVGGDMQWAACEGGVAGVVYLHANHNHLTSASTCSWPALVILEVRGNWLTSLDLTSCPPLNLTSLTASRNYLTAAPSPLPPALVFLDLSHNNITTLPVFIRTLKVADFSNNNLRRVGEGRFGRARKLHHLNLAHNHLTEITERDFYGLKKLHRLDLSHNKLTSIAASSFLPLRHLRQLHLHHNHLTHLDARVLRDLSSHTHATFHNNPWECNCQMLAALTQLQACPDCKHKRVPLQCRERDHLQEVTALLRTCLHAIQHSQGKVDESDEDLSEEQRDQPDGGAAGAVLVVPSLVIIIVLGVIVACGYKMYRKHRRAIATTFSPLCGWCGGCASSGVNNNSHNHNHNHHQEASQLPTGELQDSDTETEM